MSRQLVRDQEQTLQSQSEVPLQRGGLVGRKRELLELTAALERAMQGKRVIVALSGEPGIGKTSLAREFSHIAIGREARVLWASCRTGRDACPAYWPWRQIFSAITRDAALDSHANLAPQLAADVDASRLLSAGNRENLPQQGRFPHFDAASASLENLSHERPLVLIFDDVHATDDASLALLGDFLWRVDACPILVVVTYRPFASLDARGLARLLSETPMHNAATIRLGPLSTSEIGELVRDWAGEAADEQVVRAAGGNPRFAELLINDRTSAPHDGPLEPALRAAVEEHLALSAPARELMEVAAAIGDRFDVSLLLAASGLDPEQFLNRISEAEAIGLVRESPGEPGNYYFPHPLVRSALYDRVAGARRAAVHQRIGTALEEVACGDDNLLAAIAEHFCRALTLGSASKALEYCERAAEQAYAGHDFEKALRFYRSALTGANSHRGVDGLRRARLLLGLGRAQRATGNTAQALQSFMQAAELAASGSDQNLRAEALLEWAGWPLLPGFPDREALSALESALSALKEGDGCARARLMIRLALELHSFTAADERRTALLAEGIAMARRVGDGHALFQGLRYRRFLLAGPEAITDRLTNAQEMLEAALMAERHEDRCLALIYRYCVLISAGKLAQAEAETASLLHRTRRAEQPWACFPDDCFRAMRSLMRGRFAEAERLALRSLSFAKPLYPEFEDFFWTAMLVPFEEKGRLSEIRPLAGKAAERKLMMPAYRAMLAQIQCAMGEVDAARENFAYLTSEVGNESACDVTLLARLAALARVCARLGDAQRATRLYCRLEPYRSLNVTFGPLGFFGPVPFYLGLLARTAGNLDLAVQDFDEAVSAASRMVAIPWVAYAEYECAGALLERSRAGDRERALVMAQRAAQAAARLGMDALAARVGELVGDARGETAQQSTSAAPESSSEAKTVAQSEKEPPVENKTESGAAREVLQFREEGETCLFSLRGRTVRMRASRGIKLVLVLLAHPGTEFHVMDLERPGSAALLDGPRAASAAPQLDASAKQSYRTRLKELREELEEARKFNDAPRASGIEEEMAFLARELARAVGLHGSDRAAYSAAERARSRITQAIRAAIRSITEHDRVIGWYLAKSIRTGKFCCYRPGP